MIVLQKSSSDGIVVSNTSSQMPSRGQFTFVSKFTIVLIFVFLTNSLLLAKDSINTFAGDKSILRSLENEVMSENKTQGQSSVPKME